MATTQSQEEVHVLKQIADHMFKLSELLRQSGLSANAKHSLQVKLVTCNRALNQLGYKVILAHEFLHIIPAANVEKLYFAGADGRVCVGIGSQPVTALQQHVLAYLEGERDRLQKKACHVRAHQGPKAALKLLKEVWSDEQACAAVA
jgi:hypothetical protein